MRAQDFLSHDSCHVCGQTPCNCTHIQESYEARPVKDKQDFLNRREFLYRQLNTPGLTKSDRDVIRQAIQDLEASARSAGLVKEDLRKWFREKWVRFGPDGKIRGDCARGDDSEGKPKCLPQSKAHALGKKGRASAAARKRRQDPNAERKGKAINVATKESVTDPVKYQDYIDMSERLHSQLLAAIRGGNKDLIDRLMKMRDQLDAKAKQGMVIETQCPHCGGPAFSDLLLAEKKDACYHKVRSRYKVWPSAYASGALVQCRKKGAANWGNKSKNEGVEEAAGLYGPFTVTINTGERPTSRTKTKKFRREDDAILWAEDWLEDFPQYVYATVEITDPDGNVVWYSDETMVSGKGVAEEQLDEKCWDTHKQVGMKKKGGRMVPNCVPKESKQPASAISTGIAKTRR